MKKCPYCAEEIQDDAIKCRYCGSILDEKYRHLDPQAKQQALSKAMFHTAAKNLTEEFRKEVAEMKAARTPILTFVWGFFFVFFLLLTWQDQNLGKNLKNMNWGVDEITFLAMEIGFPSIITLMLNHSISKKEKKLKAKYEQDIQSLRRKFEVDE